jgi:hypothetical protein
MEQCPQEVTLEGKPPAQSNRANAGFAGNSLPFCRELVVNIRRARLLVSWPRPYRVIMFWEEIAGRVPRILIILVALRVPDAEVLVP